MLFEDDVRDLGDLCSVVDYQIGRFTDKIMKLRGDSFADAQALKVLEEAQEFDDSLLGSEEEEDELYDVIITALVYLAGIHHRTVPAVLEGVGEKMRENLDDRQWVVMDDGTVHHVDKPVVGIGADTIASGSIKIDLGSLSSDVKHILGWDSL